MTDGVAWRIRSARAEDIPRLQPIELAAGQLFLGVGMPEIADAGAYPDDLLSTAIAEGRLWAAEVDMDGRADVVGYAFAEHVDEAAHIGQVSVDPAFGRRGIGRGLVATVAAWGLAQGLAAVTLTTFRDVPWNAPLYRRLGFAVIPELELGPELVAVCAREAEGGLDPDLRVCMRARAAELLAHPTARPGPASA